MKLRRLRSWVMPTACFALIYAVGFGWLACVDDSPPQVGCVSQELFDEAIRQGEIAVGITERWRDRALACEATRDEPTGDPIEPLPAAPGESI